MPADAAKNRTISFRVTSYFPRVRDNKAVQTRRKIRKGIRKFIFTDTRSPVNGSVCPALEAAVGGPNDSVPWKKAAAGMEGAGSQSHPGDGGKKLLEIVESMPGSKKAGGVGHSPAL
jgi:hypothetical protein